MEKTSEARDNFFRCEVVVDTRAKPAETRVNGTKCHACLSEMRETGPQ